MRIESTHTDAIRQAMQKSAIENRYQTERQLEKIVQPGTMGDSMEISGASLERSRLHATLLDQMGQLDDVREDKVSLARERIATGFYDQEGVVSKLADRMAEDGALRVNPRENQELPGTEYRQELMQEVEEKVKSGFYTETDVMSFVADRLSQVYGIDEDATSPS